MSDNEAIRTAFHEVTAAQGGSHAEDGGWMWLEGFGDVAEEYAAIRDDVAVWDVSPLNKWEFRGPDALRGAQRGFSNDALSLEVGQVRYGAFLDADGLMVDDGTVFNTGTQGRQDHCWVMTNGRDREEYFGELLEGLDVQVEWVTPSMPHLGVIGPRSREVVQKLTDEDLGSLRYFRFLPRQVRVAGVDVHLSRTGYGGELGFELFLLDPADAETLWNAIVGAGVTPVGTEAIEVARVEAGLIVTDYDYEPHQRTPFDLGLDRWCGSTRGSVSPARTRCARWRRTRRTASSRSATRPTSSPSTARRSPGTARRSGSSRARPTARGSARSGSPWSRAPTRSWGTRWTWPSATGSSPQRSTCCRSTTRRRSAPLVARPGAGRGRRAAPVTRPGDGLATRVEGS